MMSDQDNRYAPDAAPDNSQGVKEPQASYDRAAATFTAMRRLEKADFSRPQAEGVTLAIWDVVGDLATKEDIAELKTDIARLDAEIATLATKDDIARLDAEIATLATKQDLAHLQAMTKRDLAVTRSELKSEFKEDIAALRTELKEDIAGVKSELKTDIARLETQMKDNINRNTLWMIGCLFAFAGVILAAMRFFLFNLTS